METNNTKEFPVDTNNIIVNEEEFSNAQINTSSLPTIGDIQYEGIEKTSLYVNIIVLGIISFIVLTGALLLVLLNDTVRAYYLIVFINLIVILAFLFIIEIKGFKYIGFAVREHDVIYKHGWIWRTTIAVPFNRIQHIEVQQGPLDRLFDLASITLYTAGGSNVEIEGLLPDKANSIKAYIMSKNQELKKIEAEDESE